MQDYKFFENDKFKELKSQEMGGCCSANKPKGNENAKRPEQLEKKKEKPVDEEAPK